MDSENKTLVTFLRVVRALSLYVSFVLIHLIAAFFFRTSQVDGLLNEALAANVVRTLMIPLVFFSVARIFAEEDFVTNASLGVNDELGFFARIGKLLSHKAVQLEASILLALVALLPANVGFFSVLRLFLGIGVSPAISQLFTTLIALVTVSLLYIFARLSAWQKHVDERGARGEITRDGAGTADLSSMLMYTSGTHVTGGVREFAATQRTDNQQFGVQKNNTAIFWRVPVLLAIYGFGGFALTFFAPALISFWFILEALGNARPLMPVVLLALLAFGAHLYHVCRAIRIRRRFLKNLKRTCREYGFTYTRIKRPYASLFRLNHEVNFTLQANGKTYDCKFFASVRRHCPLFFHEDGVLHCTHSLRFRRVEYLCWSTRYDFSFASEHEKVCIVCPVPATVYAGDERWHRPIDTGMAVGGYRIFSSSGFLGALTRDCIERDK